MSFFNILGRISSVGKTAAVEDVAGAAAGAAKSAPLGHVHTNPADALTCGVCSPEYVAPQRLGYGQGLDGAHEIASVGSAKPSPKLEDVFNQQEIAVINQRAKEAASVPKVKLTSEEIASRAQAYYGEGAAKQDKILHLVVGPPGAGKSSVLVNPLAEKHGARIIDADDLKPTFPAYGNGEGGGATAQASAQVAAEALRIGLDRGDNIVQPILGANAKRLQAIIDAAHNRGYQVGLHLADLPPAEAARRVFTRGNVTNQKVPPEYVLDVIKDNPQKVFEQMLQNNTLYSYSHFDTNVPFGEKPNLLKGSKE